MFTIRLGEDVKARTLDMLRGTEGARLKRMYEVTAQRYGVAGHGRRYDRNNPNAADLANQAINHGGIQGARYKADGGEVAMMLANAFRQTTGRDRASRRGALESLAPSLGARYRGWSCGVVDPLRQGNFLSRPSIPFLDQGRQPASIAVQAGAKRKVE
jgi:hypothetical protein